MSSTRATLIIFWEVFMIFATDFEKNTTLPPSQELG
jgi:hypothetical protein